MNLLSQDFGVYSHTLPSSSSGSVLFLFRPRQMHGQFRRSMAYRFDANFVNQAAEILATSQLKKSRMGIDTMLTSPDILSCVGPAADNMSYIGLDVLSYNWTFIMVVDNDIAHHSSIGLTGSLGNNRIIYSGYFVAEPINPLYHNGGMTINPNAMMVITHKTLINRTQSHGPSGIQSRVDTAGDVDIVVPEVISPISNEQHYLLRPHELVEYSMMGSGGHFMSSLGDAHSITAMGGNPVSIDTKLALPRNNLRHVLGAVTDSMDQVTTQGFGGTMYPDPSLGSDTLMHAIHMNLQSNSHISHIGLKEHDVVTMADIMARYNPQIKDIDATTIPVPLARQQDNNASNIFSSLLMSVAPAVLANCAMGNIGFFYNSHADTFQVNEFGSLLPLPEHELQMRTTAVLSEFQRNVFPLLKKTRGDFELWANFSCGGVSQCTLNFLCDRIKTTDIYEVPTILGGFNNALVGNANAAINNSVELNTLIDNLTDTHKDQNTELSNEYRIQQMLDKMEARNFDNAPGRVINYL